MTKREQLIAFDDRRWQLRKLYPQQFLSTLRQLIVDETLTYSPKGDTFELAKGTLRC